MSLTCSSAQLTAHASTSARNLAMSPSVVVEEILSRTLSSQLITHRCSRSCKTNPKPNFRSPASFYWHFSSTSIMPSFTNHNEVAWMVPQGSAQVARDFVDDWPNYSHEVHCITIAKMRIIKWLTLSLPHPHNWAAVNAVPSKTSLTDAKHCKIWHMVLRAKAKGNSLNRGSKQKAPQPTDMNGMDTYKNVLLKS